MNMGRKFEGSEFNCIVCKTKFRRTKTEVGRGRTKYCSRSCSALAHMGENNSNWSGGSYINDSGYRRLKRGSSYRYEHRLVVESHLGRALTLKEDVHHKDGNKLNNVLGNLLVVTKSEHALMHGQAGERNNKSKLSESEVLNIRRLKKLGQSNTQLSEMFGVDKSNISCIILRKTWKHL